MELIVLVLTLMYFVVGRSSGLVLPRYTSCLRKASHSTLTTSAAVSGDEDNLPQKSQETDPKTHTIHWTTPNKNDVSFEAFDGETLRTAALRRKLVSPHNGRARLINCRGLGTCGTCAVEIEPQSLVEPSERNQIERARLNFPPHGSNDQSPNLRLACQVQVRGDITVTKRTGFWGQYEELANPSDATTYFGDFEFVLDRKSPAVSTIELDEDKQSGV